MSLELPFGVKVLNPVPVDAKYLNNGIVYASIEEANQNIPSGIRHIGLTVNINNSEYWYSTGTTNADLVLKTSSSGSTINNVQNIGEGVGIFSGITDAGVINLRSITGSGSTNVSLSGDSVVINSIVPTGSTVLNDNILDYDINEQTFKPYSAYTSGVTFYYGTECPNLLENLNLNAKLTVSALRLSTGCTAISGATFNPGDIYWDSEDSTISLQQTDVVKQQIGQETFIKVKNDTSRTISNGNVVYMTGSDGGRITIDSVRASNNDANIVNKIIGITTEDIPAGSEGFVTISGLVRNLNTTGFTEGSIVYLSTIVWGGITETKPTYPDFVIEVGIITNVDAVNGRILVKINDISTSQNIRGIEEANAPFTASTRNDIISAVGEGTYYLPVSPLKGQQITIIDRDGDAGEGWEIIIDGNGKNINNDTQATINTNFGSITMVYNGIKWLITSLL